MCHACNVCTHTTKTVQFTIIQLEEKHTYEQVHQNVHTHTSPFSTSYTLLHPQTQSILRLPWAENNREQLHRLFHF